MTFSVTCAPSQNNTSYVVSSCNNAKVFYYVHDNYLVHYYSKIHCHSINPVWNMVSDCPVSSWGKNVKSDDFACCMGSFDAEVRNHLHPHLIRMMWMPSQSLVLWSTPCFLAEHPRTVWKDARPGNPPEPWHFFQSKQLFLLLSLAFLALPASSLPL